MYLPVNTLLQGGKYRIVRFIGSGGFGCTYEAEHVMLKKRFAIKEFFMKEHCNRDAATSQVSIGSQGAKELVESCKRKFIKEAQTLANLEHPNIVKIHDVFEENGTAYYAMEYIEGGSLSDYIAQHGPMPEQPALRYITQIAEALDYLHHRQMNHLDVKPGNILLNASNDAILIDFGLSKHYDDEGQQTSSTPVGISEGYAPTEQYEQNGIRNFSPATDIYSLGATFFYLLVGVRPPKASEVLNDGLPALPEHITPGTRAAIEAAMQPRRKDRPQSISEFLGLLQSAGAEMTDEATHLDQEGPVVVEVVDKPQPKPEPKPQSEPKSQPTPQPSFWRRYKGVLVGAAVVASIIGVVIGIMLFRNPQPAPIPDIEMVYVAGGTFTMGAPDSDSEALSNEKPAHRVTLSSYYIGKYEVTQEQWVAVMGSNPSAFEGNNLPVEMVSWKDVQKFIRKLNARTGKRYRLPTEAEWEFAARGGNSSRGYKYSGSNDIGTVAWYEDNSGRKTHVVGTKMPNELGIYDMTGNVYEWCQDWYDNYYYSLSPSSTPQGPPSGKYRVTRGGCWANRGMQSRVSDRSSYLQGGMHFGFRLVLDPSNEAERIAKEEADRKAKEEAARRVPPASIPDIEMVYVAGGTFTMGAPDSDSKAKDNEKPAHRVTLSSYYIGKYEVTQKQWVAVMGSNPSYSKSNNLPVEMVSWEDVQEFIRKLNVRTGKHYRLPTEAEWEFAARGGNKSRGYKYSGSNDIGAVAWYNGNSGRKTHAIGTKSPNELGIYDMSGNVSEWCQDRYDNDYYSRSPSYTPQGPDSGELRVFRDGSHDDRGSSCRVSYRNCGWPPDNYGFNLGFRLAMDQINTK